MLRIDQFGLRMSPSRTFLFFSAALALAAATPAAAAAQPAAGGPKNVILMEADGSGANAIVATGMYTGKLGKQVFDGPEWVKSWVSTFPLRPSDTPVSGPAG